MTATAEVPVRAKVANSLIERERDGMAARRLAKQATRRTSVRRISAGRGAAGPVTDDADARRSRACQRVALAKRVLTSTQFTTVHHAPI